MIDKSAVNVVLMPSGVVIEGYDRLSWRMSMVDKALPFAMSVRWGAGSARYAETVKIGHIISIVVDGTIMFVGEVESVLFKRDRASGRVLVASGRDLYGSAVFSDADPRISLSGLPLEEQFKRLLSPLKIPLVFPNLESAREAVSRPRAGARNITPAAPRVPRHTHRIKPGETIADAVDSIAKKNGALVWTQPSQDQDGGLLICVGKPSYNDSPNYYLSYNVGPDGKPTPDSNVLDMEYKAQVQSVPTAVTAYGRNSRGDTRASRVRVNREQRSFNVLNIDTNAWTVSTSEYQDPNRIVRNFERQVDEAQRRASDQSQTSSGDTRRNTAQRMQFSNSELFTYPFVADTLRPRIKHLHTKRAKDPRTGEQEARHYVAMANAKMRTIMATVQGFGQTIDGVRRLWAVNSMCRVKDSDLALEEDMLVQELTFNEVRADGKSGGQTVNLVLSTKGALDLDPDT